MKTLNTYITEKFVDIDNYNLDKKKYELTENAEKRNGTIIYQIRALRTFKTVDGRVVKKGDLGGWIETEDNLSHEGSCWVADHAMVLKNAQVYGNALVAGYAQVFGNVKVYDDAMIYNLAKVLDGVQVYGNAIIFGNARIYDKAKICGKAKVDYTVRGGRVNK